MLTPQNIIETEIKYRNVERVWQLGYQGQGETIPIIDTGVNFDELPQGAVRSQIDLTEDKDDHDYHGHGTTMARFILGIAPKAQIVSIKALGKGSPTIREHLVKALDYCAAMSPRPKFINISVAMRRSFLWYRNCTLKNPCDLCRRVNELWEGGIVVIAAAGNFSSLPDSFTCPAAARWAVKVRALMHVEKSLWRRFANRFWPSFYQGRDVNRLLGTSQAAAMMTGCAAVLASAFPQKPAKSILVVLQHTGVRLKALGAVAMPEIFLPGALGVLSMLNVYRAFVFMKHATTKPESMDYEESHKITEIAGQQLRGEHDPSELLFMFSRALELDESNYLAYFYFSVVLLNLGMRDKAQEMLDKCNELLPPGEALSNFEVFGGQEGGKYNLKSLQ